MKNKIKNILKYSIPIFALILLIMGYSESKRDYKDAGVNCNLKSLEWTQEMDQFESLFFYEKHYVSCMRSRGYLLEGFDFTVDSN